VLICITNDFFTRNLVENMFELEIKKLKLAKKFRGLKIVQISDLHISKFNIELMDGIVEKINSLNADIVVITGDFICNGGHCLAELKSFLSNINAKINKYACMGNHDYSDNDCGQKVEKMLSSCDFKLLKNSREEIFFNYCKLGIAGLDDPELGQICYRDAAIEREDIILSHNPITFMEAQKYSPALMLSGHTHGGQIRCGFLRFICTKLLSYDYIEGLYKKNDSLLYVNRGIGNVVFKPKIFDKEIFIETPRINAKAEITVFEFV